jgi:hypothetical protein
MTGRKLSAFVNALAAGRRPGHFDAAPEDVDVLRMAIALRAARPGDGMPETEFVSDLFQKLVEEANSSGTPNIHQLKRRRARTALVGIAASMALVGGTFVATEASNHSPVTTSALPVPHGHDLRTGTFEKAGGGVLGQIVAYRGHPSWIYMNVGLSQSNGSVMCKLQLDNGSIVAAGTIELHNGEGELSKPIGVNISRLRGARLSTSNGVLVGTATFA